MAGVIMADDRCYVCASAKNGAACSNRIRVPRTLVEERILASVKHDLRDPAVLEEVSRCVAGALAERAKGPKLDERHSRRVAELERQIANHGRVIGQGTDSPALRAQLLAAEAELARLKAEQPSRPSGRLVRPEPRIITERFLAKVDQLEARLAEDPERSRPALIEAIGDRIVLQPDASGRFLWAEYGLQGELMASLEVQKIMVAGACYSYFRRKRALRRAA
jgi:hypothetical protein